jgi:SAM-dependent methyltransferase
MKANGCSVTGIEINPRAAEEARAHCEEVIVADLDVRPLVDILPGRLFDVAVFGDILEHLRNPWRVLDEARSFLGPVGFVVLSIPNIAHGAIRLALLRGAFQYAKAGLLDDDHLRFFTLRSVRELCLRSGYRIDLIERTKHPLLAPSDLVPKVDPADFNASVIAAIESDPEHDTLQFIVRATPMDDEQRLSALVDHVLESENLLGETREQLERQTQELATLRHDLDKQNDVEATRAQRIAALESEVIESQELLRAREDALLAASAAQQAALESALGESRERIGQLELDITIAADQQAEFARASAENAVKRAALESALAESRERTAHLNDEIALADEQRKRLISLEKDYSDILEAFTKHTAKELEETRSEARRISELSQAIQRSPFWSLKMAIRRLSRFGRQ